MRRALGPGRERDSCKSKQAESSATAGGRLQPCDREEMVRTLAPFLAFLAFLFLAPLLYLRRPATEEYVIRTESPLWHASLNPPLSDNPVTSLAALAAVPPPIPPSPSCQPPPLPTEPICNDTAFSGQRLDKPRKLALMLMFGFEVDTLEVQLRESADLVDVIFIVEATVTHHGDKKPLMWERLQYDERFLFLPKDKVVHEVVDNLGDGPKVAKNGRGEDWWYEDKQTSAGVHRARTWADTVEDRLGPDDLFISADTDEVMSRIALHKLRWCELASKGPISGALWMPVGNLNRAYRSDFAASGRPHSFALPSIYRWEDIANGKREGKRLQANYPGPRDRYVLGGIHLTNLAFLPNALLKEITATEYKRSITSFYNNHFALADLEEQQMMVYNLDTKPFWRSEVDEIEKVDDISKQLPWFLECNPDRYPYWFGKPDPRNVQLVAAMHSGAKRDEKPLVSNYEFVWR